MEWEAPGIVLEAAPFGEGDALVTLLTAEHGAWRGLARGGAARTRRATWQRGNLIAARWVARLADQLGSYTGELVHPAAALALPDPLALGVLEAGCAVAAEALPEREPHARSFAGLARLLAGIAIPGAALPALVAWERELLAELGFALDFSSSAIAGDNGRPAFISPRTGRGVSLAAAGAYAPRLLALPDFLIDPDADPGLKDCLDGLALTGHFLAEAVFGARHRPLPAARQRLYDLIHRRVAEEGLDDA